MRWRKIGWPVMQLVVLVEAGLDVVADDDDVVFPTVGEVGCRPARPDEVVVHPSPVVFSKKPRISSRPEPEDHHRGRADVHAVGGEPHQVRRHPLQLGEKHPDPRRPGGQLDAEQLFCRHREDELVVERGK